MTTYSEIRTVSRAEMRELDRVAIQEYGVPSLVLMENAGRGASELLCEKVPGPAGVLVLAGKGNNGGDGFVIARHLFNRGWRPEVIATFPYSSLQGGSDPEVNVGVLLRMGVEVLFSPEPGGVPDLDRKIERAACVVDALLGTGLAGPVREPYLAWIDRINSWGRPVLAVDIPSGLDADTGEVLGQAVRADWTATFAAPKRGFFTGRGPDHVGELRVVEISIPRQALEASRQSAVDSGQ